MKKNILKTMGISLLSGWMVLSCTVSAFAQPLNTAMTSDLKDRDIIDTSEHASLSIYKYDITSAEAAGVYTEGEHYATGEEDKELQSQLANYAVEGVEFTYLRCGDIETLSYQGGNKVEIVYEIPDRLREILQLNTSDAVDMTAENVSSPCNHADVFHYTSQQINDALKDILAADNIQAKDALESYVKDTADAVAMPLTTPDGFTEAANLNLGLYLLVETKVPEEIVSSCNPWFASLPFTNQEANWKDSTGGQQWLYHMVCYPKNQTGNPTLDKSVRNAHGIPASLAGEYEDYSYLVFNQNDKNVNDSTASEKEYVGTRDEYQYDATVTASEGDVLDYILVSKLPHITSEATYLRTYTFKDTLSKGLTYNKDVKIAFYHTAKDANENNTANADAIWTGDEYYDGYANVAETDDADGATVLSVEMTDKGLALINDSEHGYSDYYMVVYYTVKVNSDASLILGDQGNPNDVTLTWSRSSEGYYNTLEDKCEVYSFGLNLTKTFSDSQGDATKVQFKLYNQSDAYYVVADQSESGVYYVTGKTLKKADATTFIPSADGKLLVNGVEADTYCLTEIATDNGYSLLKDEIMIEINSTSETIIPSVAGTVGLEAATEQGQAINRQYDGGIVDATGTNVADSKGIQSVEKANGRTIGKTAMYEGDKMKATAKVDHVEAAMSEDEGSVNARVDLNILNNKTFLLPQTGGSGLYIVTIVGAVAIAIGVVMTNKPKKEA